LPVLIVLSLSMMIHYPVLYGKLESVSRKDVRVFEESLPYIPVFRMTRLRKGSG
jgi:hypothetical protein